MSYISDDIRSVNTTINNIKDLAEIITDGMYGRDIENDIKNSLYKGTECGMWISCDSKGFDIGSIVEGSCAEFSKRFDYPVTTDDLADYIDEVERNVDEIWQGV